MKLLKNNRWDDALAMADKTYDRWCRDMRDLAHLKLLDPLRDNPNTLTGQVYSLVENFQEDYLYNEKYRRSEQVKGSMRRINLLLHAIERAIKAWKR